MKETYSFLEIPPNIPFQLYLYQDANAHKHWHSTVELILVLKGSVTFDVQGTVSHLTNGDLLLINSNQIHESKSQDSCQVLSVRLDLYKFDMPKEQVDQLYFLCDSSKDPNKSRYDNLRSLIALILERNASQDQDATTLYDNKSFAYSLLKELTKGFQASRAAVPAQDKYLERMNEIVHYIDSHYKEDLSLGQLASAVHLSPPYLSSLFSRYLGTTFSDYYNSVRLGRAVNDLISTDDPISTVALNNGYANAQSFGRAFKAAYGTLPSLYRKTHRSVDFPGTDKDGRSNYMNNLLLDNFGFDVSALADYLPHRDKISSGTDEKPLIHVSGVWDEVIGSFGSTYRRLVGIGSAKEILYREVQRQLEEMQEQIGFEYIKFHGLLSDEMMVVTRSAAGELTFNFKTIDMVFDYLFSIDLKPVIQLSFMPIELAKDRQKIIFNNKYNTSQPAHISEWVALVDAFFRHIITRYGARVVESLPVLLWNNADSSPEMFGMQDDLAFFQLYRETYLTVKAISPNSRMGGPSITFMDPPSTEWARQFYRWELEHGITPDFFCAQYYSVVSQPSYIKIDLQSWQPDHLVSTQTGSQFPLLAGIPLSTDPNQLQKFRSFVDRFRAELGVSHLPLWITEWNLSVSHNNLINDTLFSGCYVIKNVLEHSRELEALGYWAVSDFIEEQPLSSEIFHGGLGLMTTDGIRKPQFLAYQTLRQLQPHVLSQSEGYIITRSEDCVSVLLYNYEHFNDIFAGNKTYNVNKTTRYTPFTDQRKRPFHIRLEGLPDRPVLESVEFIINRDHGCAYDYWIKMGAPEGGVLLSMDRYRLEHLKSSAHPLVHTIHPSIRGGVLEYEAVLEPLEFRLIQITFR